MFIGISKFFPPVILSYMLIYENTPEYVQDATMVFAF